MTKGWQKGEARSHGHWINGKPSPAWISWRTMKARCLYQKDKEYKNYGGRGIRVYKRWLKFENFFADMGPRLRVGHKIRPNR